LKNVNHEFTLSDEQIENAAGENSENFQRLQAEYLNLFMDGNSVKPQAKIFKFLCNLSKFYSNTQIFTQILASKIQNFAQK